MTSVLHVISGLTTGGAETTLAQIACALQKRGMPQHVVSIGGAGDYGHELTRGGVTLTTLDLSSIYQAPGGILRLSRLVRQLRPGIVQGWMYHGNLMAALAHRLARGRSDRRLLWNLRASNMDLTRYGRVIRLGSALSAWPDVVIANSRAGALFHTSQGFHARRTEIITNGIDMQKFKPDAAARSALRAELGIDAGAVVVMNAARVDPMKDHATFLKTMADLPGIVGIMAGARTGTLNVPPNVRALGMRRDIERLYAMADIVISTSAFGEGFSNAIAEGMGAGLTPIATDVGDARLIVGDTGYIVRPGDAAAMITAISQFGTLSDSDRLARGLRARARIVEQFSLARAVAEYERLYLSLAAADRRN